MRDERRCGTCVWWVQLPPSFNGALIAPLIGAETIDYADTEGPPKRDYGQCRRMPPTVSVRDASVGRRKLDVIVSEFPDTPARAWCGEYQPTEDPGRG